MALNSTFCTFFLSIFTKIPVFYTENPEKTYQNGTFSKKKKIKKNLKNNFFRLEKLFLVRNFFVRLQKIYFFTKSLYHTNIRFCKNIIVADYAQV